MRMITAETRQNLKSRGINTRFKQGNKAASAQRGRKKCTERRLKEALITAINRLANTEQFRRKTIGFNEINKVVIKILQVDGLWSKRPDVRLKIAEMLFKHSIENRGK
jgi:hypothetical protein